MEPTHSNGEWIIIEKRNYLPKNWTPDKYDIVVIEENGYSENLCKRVIGVAGDKVEIKKGYIFLNGKKLKDPFGKGRISFYLTDENDDYLYYWGTNNRVIKYADQGETVIPEGFVWVIGDNREISWFGLLPTKNIKGLVIL
jgi:signal peptidase I